MSSVGACTFAGASREIRATAARHDGGDLVRAARPPRSAPRRRPCSRRTGRSAAPLFAPTARSQSTIVTSRAASIGMSNRYCAVRSSTRSSPASADRSAASRGRGARACAPRTDCAGCAGCCRCRARTPRWRAHPVEPRARRPGMPADRNVDSFRFCVRHDVPLQPGRKRLGDLAGLPQRRPLERLDRPRLVEVQHEVELLGQPRVEVVAGPFGLRQIQDADRALEPGAGQRGRQRRDRCAAAAGIAESARRGTAVRSCPASAGRTCLRCAGPSHSDAAVTVPAYVVKPTSTASAP